MMKRRSFLVTLAAAALVWGLNAPAAQAASVPLSSLLGTTVIFGEAPCQLDFVFDSYVPSSAGAAGAGAPTADNVQVTVFSPVVNRVTELRVNLNADLG